MTDFSPRAVIFDFDGTLLNSLPFVLRAFTHALSPFVPGLTMEVFATLGGPPEKTFPHFLGGPENLPEAMRRLTAYNTEFEHTVEAFAQAPEVLRGLHERGIGLAIWTGRDRASTERLVARNGWGNYFSKLCCGDDLASHKPDPAGIDKLLRELGVDADQALMVGDADVDVIGASEAGVPSLLITHRRILPDGLLQKCWRSVATPGEAYLILNRIAQREGG